MRARYQGNTEEARALRTYVKLMRAAESVTARTHRHLSARSALSARLPVSEGNRAKNPQKQRQYYDGNRQP